MQYEGIIKLLAHTGIVVPILFFAITGLIRFFQCLRSYDFLKFSYGTDAIVLNAFWVFNTYILTSCAEAGKAMTNPKAFLFCLYAIPICYFCGSFAYLYQYAFNGKLSYDLKRFVYSVLMGLFATVVVFVLKSWLTV